MRLLTDNKNINTQRYKNLINPHFDKLKHDRKKNRKKIIELCHAAKLLMQLDDSFRIIELREKPDFIIGSDNYQIGLEHQVLLKPDLKQIEGFFENIAVQIEEELKKDSELSNFLANVFFNRYISKRQSDKNKIIKHSIAIIKNKIYNDIFEENEFINSISVMPHDRISVNSNLGAWFQDKLTSDVLNESIKHKEKKLRNYRQNSNIQQWLLIVIGSLGESSYEYENNFSFKSDSKFDKIFLLEDFANNVYEIK